MPLLLKADSQGEGTYVVIGFSKKVFSCVSEGSTTPKLGSRMGNDFDTYTYFKGITVFFYETVVVSKYIFVIYFWF